jgi:hypothetical protein
MNDNNGGLYFVVGGIAVVVIGMVMYFGGFMGDRDADGVDTKTTIERTITPDSSSTSTTTTRD